MTTRRALTPPPVIPFNRLHGGSYELQRVQDNIDEATTKTRGLPQVKGRKLIVEMPAAGDVLVEHKLGKKPEGWHVQKAYGAGDPSFREASSDSRFITFTSASECTVEFWIF